MYQKRTIESDPSWKDGDEVKIYTISARDEPVDTALYLSRLADVKRTKAVNWSTVPAFCIFHDGETFQYLVLAWWGNDNELFTSVSVHLPGGWIEDSAQYSFCVWDLEVFWYERSLFIEHIYCAQPNFAAYRGKRITVA